MNKEKLFDTLRTDLGTKLIFLEDKPEETVESTLKALWLKASGVSLSAEIALVSALPELSAQQINTLNHLIELRLANTPLAYLTGRQNFMGIEFICDKRALIPRKETEILGRKALELSMEISKNNDRTAIIDVCCGAGNLGLTLAYLNPSATVFATDLSQDAVELARENACFLKLDKRINIKQGDLLSAFESDEYYEKVDLIVCNPPYISSSKASKLDQEISANEPLLAFDGGMFGTNVIQRLIKDAPRYLKRNGWLIFEVGLGQGEFIMQLCAKTKQFDQVGSQNDNRGNVRVVYAKK